MSQSKEITLAFDLYGTILSTESIAKELTTHFGDEIATNLVTLWRRYQLEYTWRLNSMNKYEPFSLVTRKALRNASQELGFTLTESYADSLMVLYDSLSPFPDATEALSKLHQQVSCKAVVFSNGTYSMLSNSVHRSPGLKPHANVFEDIITVDGVQKFKPHPDVYYFLADRVGLLNTKEAMGSIWLVSGNPFDVAGAKAVGMKAIWVDRAGKGWMDQLNQMPEGQPDLIVKDLTEVAKYFAGASK
ncbi:hypothetical protein ACLMJK_000073 [Lecanora helva]